MIVSFAVFSSSFLLLKSARATNPLPISALICLSMSSV
nr:MAG TPA: hypothetical protein [Caudoviricetes sp.]DAV86141.1 MAG TPA: hypothetical protein [Caudoviricetes sp.]DAZ02794.1 MAG TPA: hypothetical protein [Caudoviricetes sp.]